MNDWYFLVRVGMRGNSEGVFVCQHTNFRASKHRMMKLGRRCIVQKSRPSLCSFTSLYLLILLLSIGIFYCI